MSRGWVDLRGVLPFFLALSSQASRRFAETLGLRWISGPRREASNLRPVTSAPSPPPRCFRSRGGRLQGLAPPTSPVRRGGVLQLPLRLFLPWVLFPLRGSPPDRCRRHRGGPCVGAAVSRCSHPAAGLPDARSFPDCSGRSRTRARRRLFDPGASLRRRRWPPWGFLTSKSDCHDFEGRGRIP